MGLFDKVADFLGGSIFGTITDTIKDYLPPDMSPLQVKEFELKTQALINAKEKEANRALNAASKQLDKRIAEQEGTAKDLLQLPILGRMLIFLRGCQRPTWGFVAMWFDYKWFFGTGVFTEQQQTALIVINVLVLGFLFGERTIKNLEPLITKVFAK